MSATTTLRSSLLRRKKTSKAVEAVRQSNFEGQHYVIMIKLHVQSTPTKAKPSSDIPLHQCPFTHSSISSLNSCMDWDKIEELLMTILKSPELSKKYGSFNNYNDARGIIGWEGKRGNNDSPKVLKGKEQVEISSDVWKQHLSDYGTKVKDEKKMEKYIFIDLGLSVYQKEKVIVAAPSPVTSNRKDKQPTVKIK